MNVAHGDAAGPERTPLDLPLDRSGTTFIEASAGTGKTHALTTLVARLVIEEDRPLDRILVVTFTRAATAELRDRIRRVLGATLAAVRVRVAAASGGSASPTGSQENGFRADADIDPQACELLDAWERRGGNVDRALARRLEAAMRDVDRANIHTIHGFCQRVLADHAFESGFPFGFEVSGDGEMVARAVRDFWRRSLYPASTFLTRYAVNNGFLRRRSRRGCRPGAPNQGSPSWAGTPSRSRSKRMRPRGERCSKRRGPCGTNAGTSF